MFDLSKLSRWAVARRRVLLLGVGLTALGLLPGLFLLRSDNSAETFFVEDAETTQTYREFQRDFPVDQTLRLVVRGDALWSKAGLMALAELERRALEVPGVESATGLAFHHNRFGWPPRQAEAFRQQTLVHPLDRGAGLIGGDGRTATIVIELARQNPSENAHTVEAIEGLAALETPGIVVEAVGLPMLNRALDQSSREIGQIYLPILVGVAVLILTLWLRRKRDLFLALLFVGLCLLATLAPIGYAGVPLNLILSMLPPLLFSISLATALHVLVAARHAEQRGLSRADAALVTINDKSWALIWAGVTTILGFGSLMTSPMAPIRALGFWAAAGFALMTLSAFTLLPALLAFGSRAAKRQQTFETTAERLSRRIGRAAATWAIARRKALIITVVLSSLGALGGLALLRTESNALHYLAPEHALRQAFEALDRDGIGAAAVELVLELPEPADLRPPWREAGAVARLDTLGRKLQALPIVRGVVSAGTLLADAQMTVVSPLGTTISPQLVLESLADDAMGRVALERLVSKDGRRARVTILVPLLGATELFATVDLLLAAARRDFPEATVVATGEYLVLLEAQRFLIRTLTTSFGLSLLTIAFVLWIILKSPRLTLLALIPNIWPILIVLALMGVLGQPLDIATVMVASIALGLVVDDTIHSLGYFRRSAPEVGRVEASILAIESNAPAFLLTGLTLIAGFGVCAFSDFAPIARFGMLSAGALALALLADFMLLPALLSFGSDET